jgi:diacylglycerol kinase
MQPRPFYKSVQFAWRGIVYAVRTERHMRAHLVAAILVALGAVWLGVTMLEWIALLLVIAIVLVAELLNTALEVLVDLASPARKPRAMIIKDLAAGAVLTASLIAVMVGVTILLPYLWLRVAG